MRLTHYIKRGFEENLNPFDGFIRGPGGRVPEVSSFVAKTGSKSAKCQNTGQSYFWRHDFTTITDVTIHFYIHAHGSGTYVPWLFLLDYGPPEQSQVNIEFNPTTHQIIYSISHAGPTWALDTWYKIHIHVNGPIAKTYDLYVDDVFIATHEYEAVGISSVVNAVCVEQLGADTGWEWYVDDFYITAESNYSGTMLAYLITQLNAAWDSVTYPGVYFNTDNVIPKMCDKPTPISVKMETFEIILEHSNYAAQEALIDILSLLDYSAIRPRKVSCWPLGQMYYSRFEVDIYS